MASKIDKRYGQIYKPLLHLACLTPMVLAVCGVLAASGVAVPSWLTIDLGIDPARRILGVVGKTTINLLWITLAVTPLRWLTHNPNLLRLRRTLGVYAFVYALTHFLVYIGLIQSFQWGEIVKDLYKRWYIVLGSAALLLLIPLAVTSTNAMMRRLKRRWLTLHKLIYPIAILAICHYWIQTKKDIRQPAIYGAILAVLLGYRLWRYWRKRSAATVAAVAA